MKQPYAAAGIEPPLEELLDDEIAHLVMQRDGIGPAEVWRSVHEARARLAQTAGAAAREPPGRGSAPPPEIVD